MANIKKHLENIKGALFGKDVRSSIHDGIDAINKEVEGTTEKQNKLGEQFKNLVINEGNSNAEVVASRGSHDWLPDRLDNFDSQLEHIVNQVKSKGYEMDINKLDTIQKVNENWEVLKDIIRTSDITLRFKNQRTLSSVFSEWISGRNCPIGFYSDSTTDGATTTKHTPSVGTDSPFKVTINNSPNAYPNLLQRYVKLLYPNAVVNCYNGGFDSMSYANGFGLKQWYNTWFRGLNGSNMDWSDVKMIVLGFGISDSINMNDTAKVIDAYSIDLECTIVDCLLRGVQPVIMHPVLTAQRVGNTVSYRDNDESITIIEACQKRLAQKYDLEILSIREVFRIALDNFKSHNYSDFITCGNDLVHPNDLGHRAIASYILKEMNKNVLVCSGEKRLFPGDHYWISNDSENFAPSSKGGLILKENDPSFYSYNTQYFSWKASEGNVKSENDILLKVAVYCEKPTALFYNNLNTDASYNKTKIFNNYSTIFNNTYGFKNEIEMLSQPQDIYLSNITLLGFLNYGLNIISIHANDNTSYQILGGLYFSNTDKILNKCVLGRGTNNVFYLTKHINKPSIYTAYKLKNINDFDITKYYNPTDNTSVDFNFKMLMNLPINTQMNIYTHYNDVKGVKDSYNLIEISGDVLTLKVSNAGNISTIFSETISGLNAKILKNSYVRISYKPQDYTSKGVLFSIYIDEVVVYSHQCQIKQIWSEGYDIDIENVLVGNIEINSSIKLQGDISKVF